MTTPLNLSQRTLAMEAQQRLVSGDPRGALPPLQRLIAEIPDDPRILTMLGVCLNQIGNAPGAIKALRRAIELGVADPGIFVSLAQAHAHAGEFEAAERTYARVQQMAPAHPAAAAGRAGMLVTLGRRDEALAIVRDALALHPGDPALLLEWSRADRQTESAVIVSALEQAVARPDLHPGARAQLLFELCARLERDADYDRAWHAAERANALLARPYDHAEFASAVDAVRTNWSRDAIAAMPTGSNSDERPVFIVGMPRSGTSLVEQIIQSHPDAFGGGELNIVQGIARKHFGDWSRALPGSITAPVLDAFAADLLGAMTRRATGAARRVTDKTPRNWRSLGVLCRALPNARFVHCVRDATDTCLSCYFLDLQGDYPFKHDPVDLARYYRGYRELMDHWKSVLDGRLIEVRYEDLTADPDARIRELIEFLGLPFDERCLRPHESDRIVRTSSNEQVRQAIYRSSVRRWRRFADHLGPMREALGPYAD